MSDATSATTPEGELEPTEGELPEIDESKSAPEARETEGPFDITEVPAMQPYVDLGGIKVAPREGLQLRLDVEEQTKRVVAVSLDYKGSTLQVQAFSSPRSSGLWHGIRAQIEQQLTSQGAKVTEETGAFGAELRVAVPVSEERGGGTQLIRFMGVDGPRWTLRGVVTGPANADEALTAEINELYRTLVVVRGEQPMPPRELIPLRVPAGTEQA